MGRIIGGPLQVGGVLDGHQVIVEVVGHAVARAGGVLGLALGRFLGHVAAAQLGARGFKCGGVGVEPAFEFERGKVGGLFHGGQDDVGTGQNGAEVGRGGDAHLKFFVELHGLSGEGERGGLPGAAHPGAELFQVRLLRDGHRAHVGELAFLPGDSAGHLAEEITGFRGITGGQAGGQLGVILGGGDDGIAVARQGGDGEMEFKGFAHNGWGS